MKTESWIRKWVNVNNGGDPTIQQAPREWCQDDETFTDYVAHVIRARFGMTKLQDLDVPAEQFLELVRDSLVKGTTTISELVVNTQNGPMRVRARDGKGVGFTTYLSERRTDYRVTEVGVPDTGDERLRSIQRARGLGAA